jgi:uncharacterized peroxidase-related enzyme
VESHEPDLREEIKDEEKIRKIQEDYTLVELGPANRALLDFAKKLTLSPEEMKKADIETLRRHGFGDKDILDAVQLIGYFNYANRVMAGLGIHPEPDMRFVKRE